MGISELVSHVPEARLVTLAVGDIEKALNVQLNQYQVGKNVLRANDRDPYVDGAAGPLVRAISGLDSGEYTHPAMSRPAPPSSTTSGKAMAAAAVTGVDSSFYSNNCFDGTETDVFSTGLRIYTPDDPGRI